MLLFITGSEKMTTFSKSLIFLKLNCFRCESIKILYDTSRNIAQSTQLTETISEVFSNFSELKYFESYDVIPKKW